MQPTKKDDLMANAKRFAANVGAAILETARDARALWGRFACLGLLALVGCQSYPEFAS